MKEKQKQKKEKQQKKWRVEPGTNQTDGWNKTGGILKRKPDDNAS